MRAGIRWVVSAVLMIHGLIHLRGVAEALSGTNDSGRPTPISPGMGVGWLIAAVALIVAGVLLAFGVRWWWLVGAVAVVLSQVMIISDWSEAKVGTLANILVLGAVAYGFFSQGPTSYRARYRRAVADSLADSVVGAVVTEADLAHLPDPVDAYVRQAGAVGKPRVTDFRARIHGRIRGRENEPWMTFTGEQTNTYGKQPGRAFYMDATKFGLPVDVLHLYLGPSATMRVKLCSLLPLVNAAGPEMDRGETVTMFNDLCVLAPGALIEAPITWTRIDSRHVRGAFTNGAHTICATLTFNDQSELINFVSDDRFRSSPNGKTFLSQRWSTPITEYGSVDSRRLATRGDGRWHAPAPEGEFVYVEFHLDQITYNAGTAGTGGIHRDAAIIATARRP